MDRQIQELNEHAAMLENILEKAADGICVCHNIPDAPYVRFTHWNPRMTQITGYTMEEINRLGWSQTMYPDPEVRKMAVDRMVRIGKGDDIYSEEWVITAKNGEKKPLSISTSIIKEDIGKVHVLAIMQDISQRKMAEEALRKSEEKYRELFEKGSDLLCLHDLEGNLIQTNLSFKEAYGWSQDELANKNLRDFVPKRYRPQVEDYLKRVVETGKDQGLMRALTKDGREIIIEYNNTLIHDESGPVYVQGSAKDITDRLKNELALMQSEKKYRAILNNIEDGYYEVDLSGDFTFFNQSMCRMLGYSCSEMIGMNNREYMDQETARKVFQTFNRVFKTKEPYKVFDWQLIKKDGTKCHIDTSVSLISDVDGNVTGFRGIARDITERKQAEELIKQSEEKYRLHFNQVKDVIYSIDPEFRVLTVSPSCEKLLGYTPAQLIGKPFQELNVLAPESLEQAFSDTLRVLSGESISSTIYEFIARDGTRKFGEVSGAPLIQDNKVVAVVSVARDITERKRAEETIQREQIFSEFLINSLPGIFYLFDEKGKMLRWNTNLENVSEYSSTEIELMSPLDFFAGDEKEYIAVQIQKVFATGQADAETHFISKSGKKTPYYFTGLLIHIESKPHLIGMGIDITERKASEEALKRSQEQYRGVVENANDAIIILQDGLIVFNNIRAETLSGYSAEELAKIPFINFIIPEDQNLVMERYVKKLNGEKLGFAYTFGMYHKNGHELWVEANAVVVSWQGKPAVQCFIRDITLQKKLEAQLRQAHKLEAVGTLAGGIAHDFNNIISIILGNTELAMLDIPDWSPARKNLEESRKACFRARDVVRQILSFSRQTEQERKPIDLGSIIKESLKLLRASIPASIAILPNICPGIKCDHGRSCPDTSGAH